MASSTLTGYVKCLPSGFILQENVEAPHLDPAARPEILVKAEQNVRAVTILNCGNVSVEAFLDIKNVRLGRLGIKKSQLQHRVLASWLLTVINVCC